MEMHYFYKILNIREELIKVTRIVSTIDQLYLQRSDYTLVRQ